jgi:hypothetical protein
MRHVIGITALAWALAAAPADAATFIADTDGTERDAAPGDGACSGASGGCTLTAALDETEALPGPDVVQLASYPVRHSLDAAFLVRDNLRIEGLALVTGSPAAELTATVGGRLELASVGLDAVRLTAAAGSITVRGGSPGAGARVATGGELLVEDVAYSASVSEAALVSVQGGSATLSRVDVTAWPWMDGPPALDVRGGASAARSDTTPPAIRYLPSCRPVREPRRHCTVAATRSERAPGTRASNEWRPGERGQRVA